MLVDGYLFSSNLWYIIDNIPLSLENFLLFSSAIELDINNVKMNNLIIDATKEKVFLKIIIGSKSYTNVVPNSRTNFDKLAITIVNFLKKYKLNLSEITNIFVNQGPGKFSGIRSSITICKALSLNNSINLYGFSSNQIDGNNYNKVLDLFKKGVLIKDIIKPIYK
tara:strand:- start:728 stop:1225 length:498 start_codon:yes stop_codon:yes gene_type:complete